MKVKFYGTRGSIPVCSPEFQEFGGNTTCVLVEGPERTGIFDGGTGIRDLGKDLAKDPHVGIDRLRSISSAAAERARAIKMIPRIDNLSSAFQKKGYGKVIAVAIN